MARGKIKFTDFDKGYGYILSDDATSPSDTVLFELSDPSYAKLLKVGSDVTFDTDTTKSHAHNVRVTHPITAH
jgi:cold shock CspA family protein